MPKPGSLLGLGLLVAGPVMACGLLALAALLQPWQQRLLITHGQRVVDGLPAERLSAACDQLAESGEIGIRVLVRELAAARDDVSRAAGDALRDAIDRWEEDALSNASARLDRVARILAESVDGFDAAARARAATIAHRILLWPVQDRPTDRVALVTRCEKVIRLAGAAATGTASRFHLPGHLDFAAASVPPAPAAVDDNSAPVADRRVRPANHSTRVRMGARPDSSAALSPAAHFGRGSEQSMRTATVPVDPAGIRRCAPHEAELPDTGAKDAPELLSTPSNARPIPRGQSVRVKEPTVSHQEGAAIPTASSAPESRSAATDLDRLPTIELMRLLHDDTRQTVARAKAQLHRRGLTATQMQLARQLTDPRPSIRRHLVDSLPDYPGLDARPWLLWLGADPEADVRLAALTVMATSQDPDLLRHVERAAATDRDPRIKALGDRLRSPQPRR